MTAYHLTHQLLKVGKTILQFTSQGNKTIDQFISHLLKMAGTIWGQVTVLYARAAEEYQKHLILYRGNLTLLNQCYSRVMHLMLAFDIRDTICES